MKNIILAVLLGCLIYSCSDNSYLIDTGLHDTNYQGTVWDYLKEKKIDFDSLTKIIQLAGMQEVFEQDTITFFAPSNPSINSSVSDLNDYLYRRGQDTVKDLDQINPAVWKELLSLYIIKDEYVLKDIPQLDTTQLDVFGGQTFLSYGGVPMNVGVVYFDAGGVKYAGYRQLYYSYINDFSNEVGSLINVPVASSDIQPYNGAVHVLRYHNHEFGFISSDFINKVMAEGIEDAD